MEIVPLTKPTKGTGKTERARRRRQRDAAERAEKAKARARDGGCRFPLCGCQRYGVPEVSHSIHKGMGGNPAGDRSVAALLVTLCRWRHRESKVSIDRGTLRWEALDASRGASGPVRWIARQFNIQRYEWVELELAREVEPVPHQDGQRWQLAPLDAVQTQTLNHLARMDS